MVIKEQRNICEHHKDKILFEITTIPFEKYYSWPSKQK